MEGSSQTVTAGRTPLADVALAREAVACARPLFERAVSTHDFGESGAAHIVVMQPGTTPATTTFEQAILYEESFGDRAGVTASASVTTRRSF